MFYVHSLKSGKMFQFDKHIFEMGWNRQLNKVLRDRELHRLYSPEFTNSSWNFPPFFYGRYIDSLHSWLFFHPVMLVFGGSTLARMWKFPIPNPDEMSDTAQALALDTIWILPWKPTWNPKMEAWKMIFLFNWMSFRFQVSFRGCKSRVICQIIWLIAEKHWMKRKAKSLGFG